MLSIFVRTIFGARRTTLRNIWITIKMDEMHTSFLSIDIYMFAQDSILCVILYIVLRQLIMHVRCSEWVSQLFRGKVSSFEDKDFNYFLMESRPMLNKADSKIFRVDLWAYPCYKHL